MKLTILAVLAALVLPTFAQACDYSWERASDGSRCGGRAADQRAGGR